MTSLGQLKYHQATYDLLGLEPVFSQSAVNKLDQLEQLSSHALPDAIREWYSLAGADEILVKYGGGDSGGHPAVKLANLGGKFNDWYGKPSADFLSHGLLIIAHENQGVCNWAVRLDGSDDPPVVVEFDSSSRSDSLKEIAWQLYVECFSTFIYTRTWDYSDPTSLMTQLSFLSPTDLEHFRQAFSEGPRTFVWPGTVNYRFSDVDGRILICNSDGSRITGTQSDWYISANTENALFNVAKRVWRFPGVAEHLYSADERGEAVLKRLRGIT